MMQPPKDSREGMLCVSYILPNAVDVLLFLLDLDLLKMFVSIAFY